MTKEELVQRLVDYHAVPYRLRQSEAEELAEEIYKNGVVASVLTVTLDCNTGYEDSPLIHN